MIAKSRYCSVIVELRTASPANVSISHIVLQCYCNYRPIRLWASKCCYAVGIYNMHFVWRAKKAQVNIGLSEVSARYPDGPPESNRDSVRDSEDIMQRSIMYIVHGVIHNASYLSDFRTSGRSVGLSTALLSRPHPPRRSGAWRLVRLLTWK